MHDHGAPRSGATELPAAPADHTPRPPSSLTQTDGINADSRLAALPEELLSNIAVKLGSDDLFSLRQTCRDVEYKTLHEFAKEYFTAKCVMFSTGSLKVLVNISQSTKLGHYLKKLYIVTATTSDTTSTCPHGAACHYKPSTRQKEALLDYVADQESLKQSKKDREFLTKAFKELHKLDFLAVVGDPLFLPSGIECYGLSKFARTTKTSPHYQPSSGSPDREYVTCLSHVFRTMMLAVAQSGIRSIKRLETRFGPDNSCGLSPIADLKFKPSTIDILSQCFANLDDLSICFRSAKFRPDKSDTQHDEGKASKAMKRFSPAFRNVTNLKLSFDFGISAGPLCKAFMNSAFDLSKLKTLVLDSVYIEMKSLASLICKLKSVEFLTIHHVELTEGSWITILKVLQNLPSLNHLHLLYLQAAEGRVFFLEKDESADQGYPVDSILQAARDAGGDENEWEESSDTSDEVPDLVEEDAATEQTSELEEAKEKSEEDGSGKDEPKKPANTCPFFTGEDYRDKCMPLSTGRGYYVCLQGEEIKAKLPIFEKEYNTGGEGDGADFDVLLNTLAGNVVGGFPMPTFAPMPNAGPAAAHTGANAGAGTAGGQASAAPAPSGGQGAVTQHGNAPGDAGAMNFGSMLAGFIASNPPPAAGGNQTYHMSMPLASLLGGYPPPPQANNGQNANNTQSNLPGSNAAPSTHSNNAAGGVGAAAAFAAPAVSPEELAELLAEAGLDQEDGDHEHPNLD